jgi:hypothetical protein
LPSSANPATLERAQHHNAEERDPRHAGRIAASSRGGLKIIAAHLLLSATPISSSLMLSSAVGAL